MNSEHYVLFGLIATGRDDAGAHSIALALFAVWQQPVGGRREGTAQWTPTPGVGMCSMEALCPSSKGAARIHDLPTKRLHSETRVSFDHLTE